MYIIYSKPNCKFCDMAKDLLDSKSINYVEIKIDVGQKRAEESSYISISELKTEFPNVRTAPVITRDGLLIGGYNELTDLIK